MDPKKILRILELAIRAPSTHNSQPWLFRITENKIEVFLNPKHILPYADKDKRDLHISIGCMLENLEIASVFENLSSSISYGPFDDKNKLVEITLTEYQNKPTALLENLYKTIPYRVNARGMFNNEIISQDLLKEISSLNTDSHIYIDFLNKKEDIIKIAELTAQSIKDAYNQIGFRKEMSQYMNHNLSKKKEGLPGYSLKMPLLISLFIPFFIRNFNMGPFLAKLNIKSISSAPLIMVISGDNNIKSSIEIGKLTERIMLYVQYLGYQTSIYVGSIEIGEHYKKVQKLIKREERPQMIIALGHIKGKHRITPRHKLEDKMI